MGTQALCSWYGRPSVFRRRKNMDMHSSFHYTSTETDMHRARLISEEIVRAFLEKRAGRNSYFLYTDAECMTMELSELCSFFLEERQISCQNQADACGHVSGGNRAVTISRCASEYHDPKLPDGLIYGCLVEAYASEHNARMMAMQTATDSAKDMLRSLGIEYNRASVRQQSRRKLLKLLPVPKHKK